MGKKWVVVAYNKYAPTNLAIYGPFKSKRKAEKYVKTLDSQLIITVEPLKKEHHGN
jgi:hypothetical protein